MPRETTGAAAAAAARHAARKKSKRAITPGLVIVIVLCLLLVYAMFAGFTKPSKPASPFVLVPFHSVDEPAWDLVLIGNGHDANSTSDEGFPWRKGGWTPSWVAESLVPSVGAGNANVWEYRFPASTWRDPEQVTKAANSLISNLIVWEVNGTRPVAFLVHGLGGTLLKVSFALAHASSDPFMKYSFRGILHATFAGIYLDSPHLGENLEGRHEPRGANMKRMADAFSASERVLSTSSFKNMTQIAIEHPTSKTTLDTLSEISVKRLDVEWNGMPSGADDPVVVSLAAELNHTLSTFDHHPPPSETLLKSLDGQIDATKQRLDEATARQEEAEKRRQEVVKDLEIKRTKLAELKAEAERVKEEKNAAEKERSAKVAALKKRQAELEAQLAEAQKRKEDIASKMRETQRRVAPIGSDTFDQVMASAKGGMLVNFYAEWCGHCQKLHPEYEKAAEMLADQTEKMGKPPVVVAKVDGDAEPLLMERFGITSYSGGRQALLIVDFVEAMGPQLLGALEDFEFEHLGEVLDADAGLMMGVVFYANWSSACQQAGTHIEAASKTLASEAVFYKLDVDQHPDLREKFDIIALPSLIVFRPGSMDGDRFKGLFNTVELVQFVKELQNKSNDGSPEDLRESLNDAEKFLEEYGSEGMEEESDPLAELEEVVDKPASS